MARVRISIVSESGARIGPGKARLLEGIRDTGSISAAARDMGMPYKPRGCCSTARIKPSPSRSPRPHPAG
jgi:hypothetical protein